MRLQSVVVFLVATLVATTHATTYPTLDSSPVLQRFLRKHHTQNDEERGVGTLLEKVKRVIPSKVTDKTLQRWANNKKSPKQALTRLKLDNTEANLFEKPEFASWVTFMTKRHPTNPEAAMLTTLMTKYSDDVLTQMIVKAKSASSKSAASTKEFATKMQAEQLRLWAKQGKSSDDVFNFFTLNKVEAKTLDDLVGNPQYSTWVKYVDDINGKDPDKAKSMIAKTLTTYYTDQGLYSMLGAAKKVDSTKSLATDLQKAQIANWFANKADPKDVFRYVGAKGDSVERGVWRTYLDNYNAKYIPGLK